MSEKNTSWPGIVMQFLPELLSILLEPSQAESLERLQLCEINLNLLRPVDLIGESCLINVQLMRSGNRDKFLVISGFLADSLGAWLLIEIKYFIRGEKKYFCMATKPLGQRQAWRSFDEQNVISFFKTLKQENSFFTNSKLALLNGRTKVPVPSQLLMFEIWHVLLRQWSQDQQALSKITTKFLTSANLDEALGLASRFNSKSMEIMVFNDLGPVLELSAS